MIYFNIYIKSKLDIDQMAHAIKLILNCNDFNQTKSQTDQKRFGLNNGGIYYLFEILGLEIALIENYGEVLVDRFLDYKFYLVCNELETVNEELFGSVILYISELLKKRKFVNIVEKM